MTNISKSKIALYLVAIFVAGAVAGGAGGYHYAKRSHAASVRPDELAERISKRMQNRLNLSADQMTQLDPSVQKVCAQLRAIGHQSAVDTGRVFDRFHQQIAAFLTAEQKAELERFQDERKESFKRRCKSWTNEAPSKVSR